MAQIALQYSTKRTSFSAKTQLNLAENGVHFGSYCKMAEQKSRVKTAKKASLLFYFEKKEVRFFKNKFAQFNKYSQSI